MKNIRTEKKFLASLEDFFTHIYKHWGRPQSVEGPGSNTAHTAHTEIQHGCTCSHHTHHH